MPEEPKLPGSAPDALKQFVACTTDRLELDLRNMGWLPKPENVPDFLTPDVTVLDGSTSSRATIRVGYGEYIKIDLPASIVDGQLRVDTTGIGFGIGPEVQKWVDAFNRQLRENDKQLDSFEARGRKIVVTKRAIPAGADATAGAATGPVTTAAPGTTETGEGEPTKRPTGCFAWLAGAIAVVAVAIGLFAVANRGDDGDDAISTGDAPGAAETTTTSSSTTTEAPPAPTTTQQVGQVEPPPADDPPEVELCGMPLDPGARNPWSEPDASGNPTVQPDDLVTWSSALSSGGPCTPPPGGLGPCDPIVLLCVDDPEIALTVLGNAGTDHGRVVTDPMTNQPGASTSEQIFAMYLRTGDPAWLAKITSDCAGEMLSGQAPLVPNGATMVDSPVNVFATCVITGATLDPGADAVDEALFEAASRSLAATLVGQPYVIGPEEPDPSFSPLSQSLLIATSPDAVPPDWHHPALTLANTLAARPILQECLWFFSPDQFDVVAKVLDACQLGINDHFWVFYGATTDVEMTLGEGDRPIATSGAYVNAPGIPAPGPGDWEAFQTEPYFGNTVYPCGWGHVAYTACPEGAPAMDTGALVTVTASMVGAIPIEGDGTERVHEVDFGPAAGPVYRIEQSADGWTVSSSEGATRARALFRQNALMLVVPQDELPDGGNAYYWRTTVDGQTHEQPVVLVVSLITMPPFPADEEPPVTEPPATDTPATDPPATEPPARTETIEAFYAGLTQSISTGELDFALDRLDPTMYEAYPTACPAALESFVDPGFSIEPIAEGATGPWTWELPDGRSFEIAEATTVTIVVSGRGQTDTEAEAHLTNIDGQWHWFTFCD